MPNQQLFFIESLDALYKDVQTKRIFADSKFFVDCVPKYAVDEILKKYIDKKNTTEFDYVVEKVNDYHAFGVKNVIWIITKNRKIMVAKNKQPWLTLDWTADVDVIEGLTLNIAEMVAKSKFIIKQK